MEREREREKRQKREKTANSRECGERTMRKSEL